MNSNLKVTAISLDIVKGDADANLANIGRCLSAVSADNDIVVLPELFNIGFITDKNLLHEKAESNTGVSITTLKMFANRYNMAFDGTFAAKTGHHVYNRAFFIEPSGDDTFYDKRHLFSLSKEPELFTRGDGRMPVVRFRGWNIAMMICYELRFPVWSRNKGLKYDMMLVPANWPKARAYAWEHLLIARAIENQCAVVGVNRGGTDGVNEYSNQTFMYDALGMPCGKEIGHRASPAQMVTAEFSLDTINDIRRKMPFSADADDFTL